MYPNQTKLAATSNGGSPGNWENALKYLSDTSSGETATASSRHHPESRSYTRAASGSQGSIPAKRKPQEDEDASNLKITEMSQAIHKVIPNPAVPFQLKLLAVPDNLPPLPPLREPWLTTVFTHKSMGFKKSYEVWGSRAGWLAFEHPPLLEGEYSDNESIEFMGDKLLGDTVSRLLYDLYPRLRQGSLTKITALCVSNPQLSVISRAYGLPERLRCEGLQTSVTSSMKVAAGIFEAYIAGVYLSHKNKAEGLRAVHSWVEEVMTPLAEQAYLQIQAESVAAPLHPDLPNKSSIGSVPKLYELLSRPDVRALGYGDPTFERTESWINKTSLYGMRVLVKGEELGSSEGFRTLKEAKEMAAQNALERLHSGE